ncbi:MAG TPA: [FeFe] hydrogenase, group A, partial [Bacteroidales bacterium]|nr:[FeFe] hydrogenase, group A [Bacteroidales bacterium]
NKHKMDHSSLSVIRDPAKCILCGRCVRVCEEVMGVSCIEYINRGSKTLIGTSMGKGLNTSSCVNCGQCIMVCPTGALSERNQTTEVQDILHKKEKVAVVQYAPSISVSLAEEFGMKPGQDINGILNAALRKMGFSFVFDTTFGADLTIMEESAELIDRIVKGKTMPMFTSCCPAWVKYAEEFAPDYLDNLSTCKSPQQMTGAIIKSYFAQKAKIEPKDIISVSIMPCTAKKFEAQRDTMGRDGINDIDIVMTTRELIELIKLHGIDMHNIEPELTDSPLGVRSSAGKIFGATGGVMEAALRTAYKQLTGNELTNFKINAVRGLKGHKEARIKINDLEIGVAVVSGLANAGKLIEELRNGRNDLHFIEVMTCPGGCIAGGGQRIGITEKVIEARMNSLYEIDDRESLKVSHKNPEIVELYANFLGEPLQHKSHELLHTKYFKREVLL